MEGILVRVLFINSVVDYGSTGRIVRDLSNDLLEKGHETLIIYGRKNSKTPSNTYSIVNKLSTIWHVAMTRFFGRHGLHSKNPTRKLIKKLNEFKPDVVHLHNLHGYYLNYEMLFAELKKHPEIRVIWTHHDCWSFSGSSAYFDFNGCKVWDEGCKICESTKDYPESLLYCNQEANFLRKKKAFSGINKLTNVSPSYWLSGLLEESYLSQYNTVTINNGIDTTVFKPSDDEDLMKSFGIDSTKKILLGVASIWENRKGLSVFIELSKILKDDEQLVLVGIDSKTKATLPQNIVTIERTNSVDQLAKIYSMATFFINPTFEDNFPTTNLEALACGTPVITFNTGGSPECIDENTGYVSIEKNAVSIRDAIDNFMLSSNSSLLCRNKAEELYDKKLSTSRYVNLINQEILDEK